MSHNVTRQICAQKLSFSQLHGFFLLFVRPLERIFRTISYHDNDMHSKNRQNIVGSTCRVLRKRLGWKQHDLIARCQMMGWVLSRETLAKIESGFRRVNDAEVALLARVLNVKPEVLLDAPLEVLLPGARHSPDIVDTIDAQDLVAADEEE